MNSAVKLTIIRFLFQGVLCREFSISLPESVEAVRGLCVLIPCSFDIQEQFDVNLQGDPAGVWLKDGTSKDSNTVFNSKKPKENKIEGEILGNLLMKNCTTIFYNIKPSDGGDYYFRLEAARSLKYIYTPSVLMSVRDSPISPSITLYKEDQKELEVQNEVLEGTSLSLICSARSPPCLLRPPSFSWNFMPEERRPEQNHNTSFSSSQLNFIASHLHHGFQFTCTATYQLQNHNESAQSSHTLQVLYAPQVSSSSCNSTQDLIMCSCEVDGNPAPKLEWHLAGRPVSPTEVISIWKETQSNTSSRSLISIQSSNGTDTLQCIAFNQLGISSKVFPLRSATQCPAGDSVCLMMSGSGVDASSVLIGAAVGASGMMMLCAIFLCVRKTQNTPRTGREDMAGIVLNDGAVCQEESMYVNKSVSSESLHYSTLQFKNGAGSDIRGGCDLTTEYATVSHAHQHQTVGGAETSIKEEDKITVEKEEVTYGNITRQPALEKTQFQLVNDDDDDDDDDDDEIKNIKETKETNKEQHRHSKEAEGLYAQVKPNK